MHKGIDVSGFNGEVDWRGVYHAVDDFKGYMWQFTDQQQIGDKFFDANIIYVSKP